MLPVLSCSVTVTQCVKTLRHTYMALSSYVIRRLTKLQLTVFAAIVTNPLYTS